MIIIEMVAFIFDNLHLYVAYMGDDFEALLNLLTSMNLKTSAEIIGKTFKYQKDIYNLFWDQNSVQTKFQTPAVVFQKVSSFAENTNKLYFTSENIFFQRDITRFHPQVLRALNRL